MSRHGGHRSGSGRKRIFTSKKDCDNAWQRGHRRIWMDNILYSSWVSAKIKCGYASDSKFVRHLLALEMRRRENDPVVSCTKRKCGENQHGAPSKRRLREVQPLATSTPIRPLLPPEGGLDSMSDVDVTGVSEHSVNNSSYRVADGSVILQSDAEKYQDSDESMSDSESGGETERSERRTLTDALEEALNEFQEDHEQPDDSSDLSISNDLEHSICLDENDYENELHAEVDDSELFLQEPSLSASIVQPQSPSTSSVPLAVSSESTTAVVCSAVSSTLPLGSAPSSSLLGSPCASTVHVPFNTAPVPVETFPKLSRLEEQDKLKEELSLVRQTKVICSLDLLLDIFRKCQHPGCTRGTVVKHHLNGPTVVIKWTCSAGHSGTFCSSKYLNDMYSNNLQVAASIMMSGNNFAKVEKMANFLGLAFISSSTFYRMQRLYFIPAIDEWWSWQRDQLMADFLGKEVVVCGDGQCDSPGHTAKNLSYFLMEFISGYILEVEVRDKCHVGLASSNMERQALQNALHRLQASLNIVEVVTDASPTIKKLLTDNFTTVFHSLDVWHKSKSIRKCLGKVSHLKYMDKIKKWSDHVVLYFWHCAYICKSSDQATSDDEALDQVKTTWIGLLHHVCNVHDWSGGMCGHEELEEHDLPWFDRRGKDFETLQKIVLDPQLLASFKYYVRFRHTGSLECANNLSLAYTPKRCSYSYRSFKARKQLAAVDWNYHLNQAAATTKAGETVVTWKYNQRTKEWNSKVVRVRKQYEYIAVLMAKILKMRKEDANKVTRNVPLNESDPTLLAPTIAAKPPPPSKELFLTRKSRFGKKIAPTKAVTVTSTTQM